MDFASLPVIEADVRRHENSTVTSTDPATNPWIHRCFVGAVFGGTVGYFMWRRFGENVTPFVPSRYFNPENPHLALVNFSPEQCVAAEQLLGTWSAGVELHPIKAVQYSQSAALSDADMSATVRGAYQSSVKAGRTMPCLLERNDVYIGESIADIFGDATAIANSSCGKKMSLVCTLALTVDGDRVEFFRSSLRGKVRALAKNEKISSIDDAFVLESSMLAKARLDAGKVLYPAAWKESGEEELHGAWLDSKKASTPSTDLFYRPKWYAYLQLGYFLMYGEREARAVKAAGIAGVVASLPSWLRKPFHGQRTAQALRTLQALRGRFEHHITLNISSKEEAERFTAKMKELDIKVVSIQLPRGTDHPHQLMTSYYTTGPILECTAALFEQARVLSLMGFEPTRLKLELQLTEDASAPFFMSPTSPFGICPMLDDDAKTKSVMSSSQYYEFHLKALIPQEHIQTALVELRAVGDTHKAHLSRNAFKTTTIRGDELVSSPEDNSGNQKVYLIYFLTLRLYSTGFATALAAAHRLRADANAVAERFGGIADSLQREYAVYDTNLGLDKGWLDSRKYEITPSFAEIG